MTNKIDDRLKEEINSEGGYNDGIDCAVLIGKKDDETFNKNLLDKLETNGNTLDLESYIKMHKKIIGPLDDTCYSNNEELEKGLYYFIDSNIITYIDKDKNICQVKIKPEKISSLKHYIVPKNGCISDFPEISNQIYSLGLHTNYRGNLKDKIQKLINKYDKEKKINEEIKRKAEFNL